MKALVCEMCNSHDLIKEDGVYVCHSCGTKYSVEEAKKLMIEGTVDVSGSTVKIDNSDRIIKLYDMARREKNKLDGNALQYYEEIALERPNDWEANFYVDYYNLSKCTLGEASTKLLEMIGTIERTFNLVLEYEEKEKYEQICTEIKNKCINVAYGWRITAESSYKQLGNVGRQNYIAIASMAFSVLESLADFLIEYFDNAEMANEIYKGILDDMKSAWLGMVFSQQANGIIEKISLYDEEYEAPIVREQKSGCYVATAVYGSYDCPQVWTLRRFRDNVLAVTWYGRCFIHIYYTISPLLVKCFGNTFWFNGACKPILDRMVDNLNKKGLDNTPYDDIMW